VCRRTGHTMVGVRLLPLPQHLIHLSSQFAAPKPNLPILGSYGVLYITTSRAILRLLGSSGAEWSSSAASASRWPVESKGGLEPCEMGFLDKATSMGYEFAASFKGVMTFPSGPQKPGFDSKSGCCFAASFGRSGRHS
jgi:hypothetical protein